MKGENFSINQRQINIDLNCLEQLCVCVIWSCFNLSPPTKINQQITQKQNIIQISVSSNNFSYSRIQIVYKNNNKIY